MANSNLNKYQEELLEILAEECAEVIQEKSKIFRFGIDEISHHVKHASHRKCLATEIGDLLAVIELLLAADIGISQEDIDAAKAAKKVKLKQWMVYSKIEASNDPVAKVVDNVLQLARIQLSAYKTIKDTDNE